MTKKAKIKQEWERDIAKCCMCGEVVGSPHKGQILLKSDLDGQVRAVPEYIYEIEEDYRMKRVFLGGTCNGSTWRDDLIPLLTTDYFNPVVSDWTEECKQQEQYEREHCDVLLYVITPQMKGTYSIAEVVDDSNKRPEKTIFCLLCVGDWSAFDRQQIHSLHEVGRLVERNGGKYFTDLVDVANYINSL